MPLFPRTKIVATIGPACWDEPVLGALLAAGVSVVRFNFSHAEHDSTREKVALLRRLAAEQGRNVAALADLQGPRIRVGALPPGGITLVPGTSLTLSTRPEDGLAPGAIPVDYEGLARDVEPGDIILLDEGLLALQVLETHPAEGRIECAVRVGGQLTSHKGINVPARALSVPAVTEKDREDLAFAIDLGMDMVALSFVRTAGDVVEARGMIGALTERHVPIIAKIEKGAAVDNFAEILAEADGIMVARGDMGVELPPELLPGIQKRLIAAANRAGKPVITATQMLDSMIRNPRPTRAEATDVANAVLDGTDAVMLSGETAAGKYPLEAVQTMARIAREAERLFDYDGWTARMADPGGIGERGRGLGSAEKPNPLTPNPDPPLSPRMREVTEALCEAADRISDDLGARAIIALTRSGTSARLVAKYRPRSALIAVTDRLPTQRALAVTWGVEALLMDHFGETIDALKEAERLTLSAALIAPGDLVVFASGLPQPLPGQTTLLIVHIAGA